MMVSSPNVLELPADATPEYIAMISEVLQGIGKCGIPNSEIDGPVQLCRRWLDEEGPGHREHIHGWDIIARRQQKRGYGGREMTRGLT